MGAKNTITRTKANISKRGIGNVGRHSKRQREKSVINIPQRESASNGVAFSRTETHILASFSGTSPASADPNRKPTTNAEKEGCNKKIGARYVRAIISIIKNFKLAARK